MRVVAAVATFASNIAANALTPVIVSGFASAAVTGWAAIVYEIDPPVLVAVAIACAGGALALGRSLRDAYLAVARPRLGRIVLDGILWVEVINERGERPQTELEARCRDHRLPLVEQDGGGHYLRRLSIHSTNVWCPDIGGGHAVDLPFPDGRPYEVALNRAKSHMKKKKDPR
ncbi:MAG: hypothetical protein WEB52_11145 [Dehalococcoidia bacterium]